MVNPALCKAITCEHVQALYGCTSIVCNSIHVPTHVMLIAVYTSAAKQECMHSCYGETTEKQNIFFVIKENNSANLTKSVWVLKLNFMASTKNFECYGQIVEHDHY